MNEYRSGRVRRTDAYLPLRKEPARDQVTEEVQDQEAADVHFQEQEQLPEPEISMTEETDLEEPEQAQVLATNRTVMLCCTIAAMLSPFAAFLLYAEKNSRAIRHNSVQSAALGLVHIAGGLCCMLLGSLLSGVPGLGTMVAFICWFCYAVLLVTVTAIRLRLMLHAWRGLRYDLPLLGWLLERFV